MPCLESHSVPPILRLALTAMCVAGSLGAYADALPANVTASIRARIEAIDNTGIAIGVVRNGDTTFQGFGHTVRPDGPAPDEDTVFEIGSITKVFTALLLSDLVEQGKLTLDTPVADLLPEGASPPLRDKKPITLRMLAAHASGLPRLPDNLNPSDHGNPYGDYTVERLYDFLRRCSIPGDAAPYTYSNLGYGLLGHALGLAEGRSFERMVAEHITARLRMIDTRAALTPDMRRRLAHGHKGPVPVPGWTMPVLTGAGGLHSTVRDLSALLAAFLGRGETALRGAMDAMLEEQGPSDAPSVRMCLGWHRLGQGRDAIYWQNGGTGGCNGFIGFAPSRGLGVAVLTNSTDSVDDIGLHLIDPSIPLRKPWRRYPVDDAWLHACAGRYRFAPGVILETEVVEGILTAKLNDQPRYPVYPVTATRFAYRAVPAELAFEKDDKGDVIAVTLHQDEEEQRGVRE